MTVASSIGRGARALATLALSAVLSVVLSTGALAAPQILAVAATDMPQPLHCEDGICAAEFSSFCLQKQRSNPAAGTPYKAVSDQSFMLIYDDADGIRHAIPGGGLIQATSNRGFTSVRVTIDQVRLDRLGAVTAALDVANGATLVPLPEPDDPDPVTEDEIAMALQTLKPLADQWLGGTAERVQAVRLVNTLINLTPLNGRLSDEGRKDLWDQVAEHSGQYTGQYSGTNAGTGGSGLKQGALSRAQEMYDACLWRVEVGRYHTMRACLGIKHDSLMQDMNLSYWKATDVGS